MRNQALLSSKDKSKKIKMSSAAIFVWRYKLLKYSYFPYVRTIISRRFGTLSKISQNLEYIGIGKPLNGLSIIAHGKGGNDHTGKTAPSALVLHCLRRNSVFLTFTRFYAK